MADQIKNGERRKYQRVLVESAIKALRVVVKGYGSTTIFDMSYSGGAFAQPKEKSITTMDETLTLDFITEIDEASVEARPIRLTNDVVAVQFHEISSKARVIIDRVVTDRIVGLNMSLVDPKHYSGKAGFSFWFHGPKETNLYIWLDTESVAKVQLDMENSTVIYEQDSFFFENKVGEQVSYMNNQQIASKALSIVQQMDFELKFLREFKTTLAAHVQG